MTAIIKVKVQRKAIVKLKGIVKFPADVVAEPGIIITRAGRTYTFSLDPIYAPTVLGLVIGTNVQAYDATLTALAGVTTAANKLIYATGSDVFATTDFTAAARALLDDANASAMRTTLGLAIGTDVQAFDSDLSALAANSTLGIWAVTGAGTGAARTLTAATGLAWTNPAGTAGNPSIAYDITALTTDSTPDAANDYLITYDASAGTPKKSLINNVTSAGASGVSSLNGQTGALKLWVPPQGRLTLASLTPVMLTSQSAKTTVYYTSYIGSMVPIFDGTNLVVTDIGQELSQTTTDTTKSPAAVAANKNYDIFVWNDSGTFRATRGPAWTSDSARGTGAGTSELSDISVGSVHRGIQLNTNAITNGPAALRGTYVGTIRSDGSSQINFILGASASGGTAAVLGVWNAFNRVLVATTVTDSGASYTYTSATIRQARASAGNQISMVSGLVEDGISVTAMGYNLTTANASAASSTGVGLNSTTTYAFQKFIVVAATAAQTSAAGASSGVVTPALGWNTISMNENGDGSNANNFNAGSTASLSALLRM